MLGSISFIVGAIALAMAPLAHTQAGTGACGGQLAGNGTYFEVTQTQNFSILTMANNDGNILRNVSYLLYCTDTPPTVFEVMAVSNVGSYLDFKVPLNNVMVDDTYTSTYIELVGKRNNITILSNPQNIVSPCLQQGVANNSITAMTADGTQYAQVDAAFRENQYPGQAKDIWMPHSVDIEPLARADYIRAVSLFFNQGVVGQTMFDEIAAAYNQHRDNMKEIPQLSKRRIGWIRYDFNAKYWTLRNSKFTTAIIQDAGGIPFPLSGTASDNSLLTTPEVRTLILNSQVLIDQSEYPSTVLSQMAHLRQTAGFDAVEPIPVLDNSMVFSLDLTRNTVGSSDYSYRVAARPDLLLKDMIRSQYPAYQPTIGKFTFFNTKYGSSTSVGIVYNSTMCGSPDPFSFNNAPYFNNDILTIPVGGVQDLSPAPPPPTGGGMYGSYDGAPSSAGKSKSKIGIVVGVLVAATVMSAGFAFAFFKWGKRAKEDRFIELEEEMNNEIPLH